MNDGWDRPERPQSAQADTERTRNEHARWACAETARVWTELRSELRSKASSITSEARHVLRDLDGPPQIEPTAGRRAWRRFRHLPAEAQVVAAVVLFAVWALLMTVLLSL